MCHDFEGFSKPGIAMGWPQRAFQGDQLEEDMPTQMIKSRSVLPPVPLLSNKHGRPTFKALTQAKALTQVVLCHTTHTATSTYLKRNSNPHTGQKAPGKRPVYDKRRKAKPETKACLKTYVVIFIVVRKGRKSPSAPELGTPHYDVCRGRLGNVQFGRIGVTDLAWKTQGVFRPRCAVQTATRNSIPPGLRVAYSSFLQLQSPCRESEALMLRNHSGTVRHALASCPWALPLISQGSSWSGRQDRDQWAFLPSKREKQFCILATEKMSAICSRQPHPGGRCPPWAPSVPGTPFACSHLRQQPSQHALWTPLPFQPPKLIFRANSGPLPRTS